MPGSILGDMGALLAFIGVEGLPTGSDRGNLPSTVLVELNQRLSQPITLQLERPLLRDYPNIAGLYALARIMGLVGAGKGRVQVNRGALDCWSALNPTEQYFALLEAWLIHADGSLAGNHERERQSQFIENLSFLGELSSARQRDLRRFFTRHLWTPRSAWNVQLQMRFGWIEVISAPGGKAPKKGGWSMAQAWRTPWGTVALWALTKYIEANGEDEIEDLTDDLPEDADYGFFQPVFQPLYPEWQKRFALPQKESRAGVYVFKVGFAPHYGPATVWRRLALPHKATLAVLGKAILKAFKLDPEDGYELSYADGAGKTRRYGDPDRGRPPFADEMALGNCDLAPTLPLRFRNHGYMNFEFLAKLERIDPPDPKLRTFKLLEACGEASTGPF